MRHADLMGRGRTQTVSLEDRFKLNIDVFLLEAELHTSCWLQIARSETFPQPTGTTSKQRSGSQPKTRRESVAPL